MKIKKTSEADLEKERTTYFLLGFTVVLATLFVLLEWKSEEPASHVWGKLPLLITENEYNEALSPDPVELIESETKVEPEEPESPKIVYEDYNIVEKTSGQEADESSVLEETETHRQEEQLPTTPSARRLLEETLYTEADHMPQYPGGAVELNRYLFHSLQYPASAYAQGIQGRVWCSFIVNKNGSVSDIRIEQSVFISLDQEAVRVLSLMPAWIPGNIRNEPVRVKVYVPIVFKL